MIWRVLPSVILPTSIVLHPTLSCLLCCLHELVRQKLVERPAFARVLDKAFRDEISEGVWPLGRDTCDVVVDDCIEKFFHISGVGMEWRIACSQLKCKTAEGPNINFLCIGHTLCDFRWDPGWGASLSFSPLLLLGKENTETHVSYLYVSIRPAEYIIRLYISVKYISFVHCLKALCNLVQAPLAERLWEVTFTIKYNLCQVTTLHQLQEDPDTILEVVHIDAVD